MIILNFNLNGARASCKKGLLEWLRDRPEIDACLFQELKAGPEECEPFAKALRAMGYAHVQLHCAERKGYAGTALCSRATPDEHGCGFGSEEFDPEGRLCHARYGRLELASAYFPSGSAGEHRQASKMRFLAAFEPWLSQAPFRSGSSLVGADLNIARSDLDLRNWKGNLEAPGCTSAERAWLESWLASGWSDPARELDPHGAFYTWWSPRAGSRQRDVGWRIDAQICTKALGSKALRKAVHKTPELSDHAPMSIEYAESFAWWSSQVPSPLIDP